MTLPHLLFLILINLIWGSMFVAAAIGLRDFPPVFFTAMRFAMLAAVLFPFLPVPRRYVMPLIRVAMVMGVGMYLTLYLAIYLAENTAAVAVFSQLEVPIAVLLGVFLLKEQIVANRMIGVGVACSGAAVIGFDPAALEDLPALFWITVSAVLYAYTMIMVRRLTDVPPMTITAWLSTITAPVLFVVSLAFEDGQWTAVQNAGWAGWSALVYTAFFGSIIAHTGMYYLLQRYPVGLLVPFYLLSPLFAALGGVLFLEDALTTHLLIGGALLLGGVFWVNRSGHSS